MRKLIHVFSCATALKLPTDFKDTYQNILTYTLNCVFLRNTEGLNVNVNVFIEKV